MTLRWTHVVPAAMCLAPLALVTGCAVGPDFNKPARPAVDRFTAEPLPVQAAPTAPGDAESQMVIANRDLPAEWWTLFHSPSLDALIRQAIKANPDLQSAEAALKVAEENVLAQQGAYFPTVQANFTPERYHNATQPSPTLATFVPYFNLYTAQVSASWTPDIFGLNRREVESLAASAEAQAFQRDAALLTLTSALAAAAIQEASLRAQISATQALVLDNEQVLSILKRQLSRGQIAADDVATQEATLSQALQGLLALQKQLALERDLLTVLAGQLPQDQIAQTFEINSLTLPHDLPIGVPSRLVDQRPDVRMAESNLHTASAEIGVAIANMLPNVTLSATDGTVATQLAGLFGPGNGFWTIGASVTQTVFDGGTLLHKTRAARAAYDQAAAQYRSTVLTAFQNVADALESIKSDAGSFDAAVTVNDAAQRNLASQRLRLRVGDASPLDELNADIAAQQATITLVQARAARLADTVSLFQALGGGWAKSDDRPSADDAGGLVR